MAQLSKFRAPVLIAIALVYFAYHLMNGERGVYAFFRETHKQELLEKELAQVSSERQTLELKVTSLRSDSLDLDLLDQQAREMLGMMGEDEKVILLQAE